ncbi:MAG: M20 family metallopeptidase [Caulobacteraceae bacterium]
MLSETLRRETILAVDDLAQDLISISHRIHAEPELALEEVKSAALLAGELEQRDLPVQREAFGLATALVSEFGRSDGPRIAILSEYDALPGIGHACGHNIIAAAGLGAALALSRLELPGRVRWLGTPAEERYGGKELMARAGAFEKVDAAMMIHPANHDLVSNPTLAIAEVDAIYHGRAAHASSSPYLGLNALDAVVGAYQAIAQLRQHIRGDERIHGIITEGGLAPNVVPERAACQFYVRAANAARLGELKRRVQACFEAGALSSGCRLELVWGEADYLDLKTSWPAARIFEQHARSLGRVFTPAEDLPPGKTGSTDMGNVSHRVPAIHPMLAVAPHDVSIHNPQFARWAASERGDMAVIDGAKALALTALELMADEAALAAARRDFQATAEASRTSLGLVGAGDPGGGGGAHQQNGQHVHAGGCGCA